VSGDRPLVITAPGGGTCTGGLTVDGHAYDNDWLTFAELAAGGALAYRTGTTPGTGWAAGPAPAPSACWPGDEGQPRAFRLIRMPAGFPGARLPVLGICSSSYWKSQTGAMENDGPLLTIGELARRVGVPVRTIRFWSDSGLVPPASRTDGDRRLYDAACVARLELVTTLRELGVSLASVRRVLDGQVTAAAVAAIHLEALDTEIRALRLRRAVVAAVVKRSADGTEMGMINKLARLSAAERRQIIDDFTAEVFAGLDPSPARFARWAAAPDLPDDPSAEQVEAWVDLAELVADRAFREQVRQVAGIGVQIQSGRWLVDVERAQDEAEAARQRGVPPDSAEAGRIVARILAGTPGGQRRAELLAQLEAATDPRIERYWELTAVISGRGPFPSLQRALEWLAAALRASQERDEAGR
jgi:DNA-binding transcriptional MerR regulator